MKLHIDVTQEDINNGKAVNCELCPIALAVKRALSQSAHNVSAADWIMFDWKGIPFCSLRLHDDGPQKRFMDRFDQGLDVYPFSFDMEFYPLGSIEIVE